MFSLLLSAILSISGYLYLSGSFWSAFVDPYSHRNFVDKVAMVAFLTEFLSLHSSAVLIGFRSGQKGSRTGKIGFFVLYMIFALALGKAGWRSVLNFLVSLWARFFGHQASQRHSHLVFPLVLFIFLLPVTTFLTPRLRTFFPLAGPWEHLALDRNHWSWRAPQEFLLWGVLYYGILGLREASLFIFFLKRKSPKV